jgi:hypothetical protein
MAAGAELAGVAGEWATVIRPGRGKALVLFGRPAGIALVVVRRVGALPVIALVRFDLRVPTVRVVTLDPRLVVPGRDSSRGAPLEEALGLKPTEGGPPRIPRFVAHDAIGRWLEIEIDDLIGIDSAAWGLPERTAGGVGQLLTSWKRPKSIARMVRDRGGGRRAAIACDWPWHARLLGLLRLRRLDPSDVHVVRIGKPGEPLDADDVAIAKSVLDPLTLRRPRNQRESLKRVEWA